MQLMRDGLFTLIFILKLIQTAERPVNAQNSNTPQNTTNEFMKMIYKEEVEVAYNYGEYELGMKDIIKFLEYNELKGSDENLEIASESSNHTKGFETDKNSSMTYESIEEMRMEIIGAKDEMDATLKDLNDYLDNAYDQTKVVFDLEDDNQKFLTFVEDTFEKLKNAFDEIVQNYYDRNTDYSELSLLDFDYEDVCKNIEALICNLKKEISQTRTGNNPNVLDTHQSQSADSTRLLILYLKMTSAPEDEHIPDELIFRISDAAKKLHLMSEFLLARFSYDQSFARWTDLLKVWYKNNSLHIYIVTELNELREGVSQGMGNSFHCADGYLRDLEEHLEQEFIIRPYTNLFPIVNLVKTMLKDTGFEKGFVDLIIACCNSSMNFPSMGTNMICIKASIEDRMTFGDLLHAYWLFAVETKARLIEKKLIESELTLMMMDLKASMFKLYNAVCAINDVSEGICLDCRNLVNSLPYKVKNLFETVHARLKIAKKENEEYEMLKMQILRILKEETLVLVDKEMAIVIQDAFELERFEVKDADGKILYHFKFLNAYEFENLDAAKKVLKKLLHHRNAKQSLIKVKTIAFNSAWEHEKQTVHDNNDSLKKFRAKICAIRTLVDIFEADKIDFINRSTNDKDKEIFNAIIDEKMQLLLLILKVYEEDINIIECKNLAKLMKVQSNKYSGDPKYAYDIFDLALRTRYRLDLACISINSYAVKTKLIKDIARIKISHKDPANDVFKLIYQLCVANGYTSENLLVCDLQNMIQQRVAEMKCIVDDFDSYCEEQAQCETEITKKSKPHEKGPFGFLHKNLYISSRFARVYLKQKQLLDVSEEGKTSKEWKDKYVAWIESLHVVFENTLTNFESKIASSDQ